VNRHITAAPVASSDLERAIQAIWDRCSDGFMSEEAAAKAEAALRADAGLVRMTLILTEERP
jgi:hypothetical protein